MDASQLESKVKYMTKKRVEEELNLHSIETTSCLKEDKSLLIDKVISSQGKFLFGNSGRNKESK